MTSETSSPSRRRISGHAVRPAADAAHRRHPARSPLAELAVGQRELSRADEGERQCQRAHVGGVDGVDDRPSSVRAASASPALTASDASWFRGSPPASCCRSGAEVVDGLEVNVVRCRRVRGSSPAFRRSARRTRRTVRRGGGSRRAGGCRGRALRRSRRGSAASTRRQSCSALCRYGILDRPVELFDGVDRSERTLVVADLDRGDGPCEQHLGPGVLVQTSRIAARSSSIQARPSVIRSRICQNSQSTRNMCGSGRDVVVEEPSDRDSQVLLLDTDAGRPIRPVVPPASWRPTTSSPKYLACRSARSHRRSPRSEPLGRQLADRHEHAEPGLDVGRVDADEAVAGKRVEQIERPSSVRPPTPRGGVERPSVDERPTGPPAARARRRRGARSSTRRSPAGCAGARAGRPVPCPARRERVSSRSSNAVGCEQPRASRGQLDRERQPVETSADLHHGGGVVVGPGEVAAHSPGAIDEQAHGGQRWRAPRAAAAPRTPAPSARATGYSRSAPQPQHGAARGEDRDAGAADEELIELGRHAGHLLEVVEDEQRRGLREVLDQGVERRRVCPRSGAPTAAAMRGSTSAGSVIDASGTNSVRRPAPVERGADRDRQPGLADPTRARQRDQPHVR